MNKISVMARSHKCSDIKVTDSGPRVAANSFWSSGQPITNCCQTILYSTFINLGLEAVLFLCVNFQTESLLVHVCLMIFARMFILSMSKCRLLEQTIWRINKGSSRICDKYSTEFQIDDRVRLDGSQKYVIILYTFIVLPQSQNDRNRWCRWM